MLWRKYLALCLSYLFQIYDNSVTVELSFIAAGVNRPPTRYHFSSAYLNLTSGTVLFVPSFVTFKSQKLLSSLEPHSNETSKWLKLVSVKKTSRKQIPDVV
ncbi:unnamed protein product [Trichobilharzia szidati]|nr:unnamed protein product [Trichobilharzia szidati]